MRGSADIVDQYINATEPVDAGLDHDLNRSCTGDIALMRHNLAANASHALDGLVDALEITVDGKDCRTFFCEADGSRAAVTPTRSNATGTRNDCDSTLEPPAHDNAPVKGRADAKR
jgi:hypothetical protein